MTPAIATPSSGLIIKPEPLQRILNGSKTWEMRSISTGRRGPIALIEKGGRRIIGVASITSVQGPLTDQVMQASVHLHGITPDRLKLPEVQKYRYAWVLSNIKTLHPPVPFSPRNGAVTFVNLNAEEQREIALRLPAP
jgi:hypothetical protein